MTNDETACSHCGESPEGGVAWWAPSNERLAYLEEARDLGWFATAPEAPLCRDCEAELRNLRDTNSTGVWFGDSEDELDTELDSKRNELTDFLDELDLDAFREKGMEH